MAAFSGLQRATWGAVTLICAALASPLALAQGHPVTHSQRATAEQVAAQGVPLAELSPDAPDTYIVKSGDTLSKLARTYSTSVSKICQLNHIKPTTILRLKQRLRVK